MKIIKNALWFPFQMDYEKPKKTSMMQTGLKILGKNLYLFFDVKLVKIIENAREFHFQMDYEKPKKTSMMQTGLKMQSTNLYFFSMSN